MNGFCTAIVPFLLLLALCACPVGVPADEPNQSGETEQILERFEIPKHGDVILVPVIVGGKQYRFVVDTGFSGTVFDNSLLTGPPKQLQAANALGQIYSLPLHDAQNGYVGKLPLPKNEPVGALDCSKIREVSGHEIYGILGLSFLKNYVFQIDFDRGELLFLKTASKTSGQAFPITFDVNGMPYVSLHIGDWGKEEFQLDTGCSGHGTVDVRPLIFYSLEKAGHLKITDEYRATTAVGEITGKIGRIRSFSLGGFQIENPVVNEQESNNLLGLGFLSRFVVTIDFPNKTLYLKEGKNFRRPDRDRKSGLSILRRNGKTVVHSAKKDSPGETAGIRADDVLLAIDGVAAEQRTLFEIRSLFGGDERTIPLTIQRGEQVLQVSLVLKKGQ